jgi:hypothetical protein
MINHIAKNLKKYFFLIIMTLIILKLFNTSYNFYSILNWNYKERLKQNYGVCDNESWGFYDIITNKFNLSNSDITIINDEGHITLENLFNLKKNNNTNNAHIILLNYQSENNQSIFNKRYSYLNNYQIIYRLNNCYLLKKND